MEVWSQWLIVLHLELYCSDEFPSVILSCWLDDKKIVWPVKAMDFIHLDYHPEQHTHTTVKRPFVQDYPGRPVPEKNIHPLTPVLIIGHPLSTSSIYNDPWHLLCSVYELDSLLGQPLSRSSLVFLLALDPQLHTPCISHPIIIFSQHMPIPLLQYHTVNLSTGKIKDLAVTHIVSYHQKTCMRHSNKQ